MYTAYGTIYVASVEARVHVDAVFHCIASEKTQFLLRAQVTPSIVTAENGRDLAMQIRCRGFHADQLRSRQQRYLCAHMCMISGNTIFSMHKVLLNYETSHL